MHVLSRLKLMAAAGSLLLIAACSGVSEPSPERLEAATPTQEDVQAIQGQLMFDENNLLTLSADAQNILTPLQYEFALDSIERSNLIAQMDEWEYTDEPTGQLRSTTETNQPSLEVQIGCGDVADRVYWTVRSTGPSLAVEPTECGFDGANGFNNMEAWAEVLRKTPSSSYWNKRSGTKTYRSMYDQFVCHFIFVKRRDSIWNHEPWRPNVGLMRTVAAECNPNP